MSTQLVRATTSDGLRLDGALHTTSQVSCVDVDAAILLHGVGGNFYGGVMFAPMTEQLIALGVDVLRVNTRGHDGVYAAKTNSGRTMLGAAYERVGESTQDIEAWTMDLLDRGYERIALLGHSLGAIKAIYSQAVSPQEAIQRVIALSAPRLAYSVFANGDERAVFLASLSEAESLVRTGKENELFRARFPFPMLISAATYLDKYGPDERYDITRYFSQLSVRTLVVYGEEELDSGGSAFHGLLEDLKGLRDLPCSIEFAVVAGADHFYSGVQTVVAESVSRWLLGREE